MKTKLWNVPQLSVLLSFMFEHYESFSNYGVFLGKFYDNGDRSAPILSQSFDGSQNDLVLTLPDDIEVKDLKWISVWCRRFELTFGDFVFPEHSDGEGEVPRQDVVKPQKKPQSSGTLYKCIILSMKGGIQ